MKIKSIGALFFLPFIALLIMNCGRTSKQNEGSEENASSSFNSNGEQIYFTATSQRGDPITFEMMGMMHMQGNHLACVNCHGQDGRGRSVSMMMGSFETPDIRYKTLTSPEHVHHEEQETDSHEMHHPPYSEETIKRAITEGVDPAGNELKSYMPRWRMSDEDLKDLIDFLKTLE